MCITAQVPKTAVKTNTLKSSTESGPILIQTGPRDNYLTWPNAQPACQGNGLGLERVYVLSLIARTRVILQYVLNDWLILPSYIVYWVPHWIALVATKLWPTITVCTAGHSVNAGL